MSAPAVIVDPAAITRRTWIGLGLAGVFTVAITSALLRPHRALVAPSVAQTAVASAAPSAGSTREQLTFFSLAVPPGESFVVHDPLAPQTPTAVLFTGNCMRTRALELGDASGGPLKEITRYPISNRCDATIYWPNYVLAFVEPGVWTYRVVCDPAREEGADRAGHIVVQPGDARATINLDGRAYRIDHGTQMPDVTVGLWGLDWPRLGACESPSRMSDRKHCDRVRIGRALVDTHRWTIRLHIRSKSGEHVLESSAPKIQVPGDTLRDGDYSLWAEGGEYLGDTWVARTKTRLRATLVIATDAAAMPFRLESPSDGARWGATLSIRGATLHGTDVRVLTYRALESWSEPVRLRDVAIDRVALRVDSGGRFSGDIPTPQTGILVIETRHPSHGTHYFLRRAWHAGGIAQPGEID